MQIPGVHVETMRKVAEYSPYQIDRAVRIAHALRRGKLVLCEPPRR